ncbi:MAG: twin-arginine translocase subunit TatC [Bacillota bacterium]
MISAAPARKTKAKDFDPESYRMSLGDHLEELRWRLIFGLLGFLAAAIVCLIFGERVMSIFCQPLVTALQKYELNPQVYMTQITDSFMVYMEVSLISAAAIASPWLLYQLWQFVSAGLYPHERRYVTKYMPFSIGLLITGMLFLYFVVLPITLNFLIHFTINIPVTGPQSRIIDTLTPGQVATIPVLPGDPAHPVTNQIWVDSSQWRLKIFFHDQVRVIPLGPQNLIAPMVTLLNYIDMVMNMLLMFGLAFQLPLIMLALVRIGIVDVPMLRKWRRVAYFIIAVVCGFVVPDVVTGMIAMMLPLMLLYELGILLASRTPSPDPATGADGSETDQE